MGIENYDFKNNTKEAKGRSLLRGLKTVGICTTIGLGFATSVGVTNYYGNKAADNRAAHFSNLPIENVIASDETFYGMRNRITEGLPEEARPSREEFFKHALENNPGVSYHDLHKNFGSIAMSSLDLPDYDGKPNN